MQLRRTLLALLVLIALGVWLQRSREPAPARLVVLVVVDTLRLDAVGCYTPDPGWCGTPHMDRLATEGVRFDGAYSSSGWTLPAVASIFTGVSPEVHGAVGRVSRLRPISPDVPVLAELFGEGGYHTIGVANAAFLSPLLGLDRGFDIFDHEHAYNSELRRASESVADALGHLERSGDEDVFLFVHLFDPHLDYQPRGGLDGKPLRITLKQCQALAAEGPPGEADVALVRAAYQAEVREVDLALGELRAGLERLGRWDEATLLLTSDHGEEFWDHGGFEHGHSLYGELVHVPLLLKLPAAESVPPRVVAARVGTLDAFATLLQSGGVALPDGGEGASLLPLVRDAEPTAVRRIFGQGTLYGDEKLTLIEDPYQLIVTRRDGADVSVELYDLVEDPLCLRDLSIPAAHVRRSLSDKLAEHEDQLRRRAAGLARPALQDMSPTTIREHERSLRSLGYTGR